MKFLFCVGFFGVLSSLIFGLITGNYALATLMALAGIGTLIFSLPFLILPVPVQIVAPLELNLSMKMDISHKCGDSQVLLGNGDGSSGDESDDSNENDDDDDDEEIDPDDPYGLFGKPPNDDPNGKKP